MEKADAQLVAHVPSRVSAEFKALAEAEKTTPSEYMRFLIESHLKEKRAWYERMTRVFGAKENQ